MTGFVVLAIYALHAWVLARSRSLTTHSAREWAALWIASIFAVGWAASVGLRMPELASANAVAIPMVVVLLWLPGVFVYSMPSSPLGTLPLLLHYFIFFLIFGTGGRFVGHLLTFAYLPLASYLFPWHRRLADYWRPTRLPRLARRDSGVTLIELLIAMAILSIVAAGISTGAGLVYSTMERQNCWLQAIALAEDEIALLRARDSLPELGRHPLEPELTQTHPLAGRAEVEIRPGPQESLREARVHVRLQSAEDSRDVTLTVLLPAHPSREGES